MTLKQDSIVILVVVLLALAGALYLRHSHRMLVDALGEAEAAKLKMQGQIVMEQDDKATLHATVEGLLAENSDLRKKYDQAKLGSPGLQDTGAASLSTGPVQAHGIVRIAGTPLPEPVPAPSQAVSNPPPAAGGHSGEAAPAEGGLKFDQAAFSPGCLLAEGDKAEIRVKLIEMKTQKDNRLLVGAAEVWRTDPPPASRVLQGLFDAPLSDVAGLAGHSEPRWGAGLAVACGRAGCAPGGVVLLPPLSFWSVRLEGSLALVTGPVESHIVGMGALRF